MREYCVREEKCHSNREENPMRKKGVMSAAPLMPLNVAVAAITMHAGNMNQYTIRHMKGPGAKSRPGGSYSASGLTLYLRIGLYIRL